ncbi:MAG: plastocyanin/azurin family copper-binding protein [Verrucomicrobiales bacterium]|nr:plastocyanin/azurin family copper-binding protein [Verrucomicrobiales bacterium]
MKSTLMSALALTILAVSSAAKAEEVFEVTLTADKVQFIYDIKEFTVKPGQQVKLTLINPSDSVTRQPHNVLIVKPGKKDVVGMAANAGMTDPAFLTEKNAIPESEDILFHSKLIQAGEEDVVEFTAPEEAGEYPYLCTYPGHWAIMNGVMTVAE